MVDLNVQIYGKAKSRSQVQAPAGGLLQASDFTYLGAFKAPGEWAAGGATFEYSTGTIGFNPSGNGGAGSIFMPGHVSNSLMAELTIPTLRSDADPNDLNAAAFLGTHFVNCVTLGGLGQPFVAGMVYNPDDAKMYYIQTSDYDDYATPAASLGRFTTARSGNEGIWYLGSIHPFNHARNPVLIPSAWASSVGLSTRRIGDIRKRGAFQQGPNFYIWTPPTSLADGGTVSAYTTCAAYTDPGGEHPVSDFNERNMYMGAVWAIGASGKQAVLISGFKHYTKSGARFPDGYYGYDGYILPDECEGPPNTCPEGGRGHRAADVRMGWWLFDPAEYAAVIGGQKQAYEPNFYSYVLDYNSRAYRASLPECFLTTGADAEVGRATFDYVNHRLFISEAYAADSDFNPNLVPVVHVYSVA